MKLWGHAGRNGDGNGALLEVRLESLKHASNLRLDFLKRFYDWRSVAELYGTQQHCLNVHFRAVRSDCGTYCAGNVAEIGNVIPIRDVECELVFDLRRGQSPMLVGIGQVFERGRPSIPTIRLQPLDECDVCGVEALEPTSPNARFETFLVAFNWKLGAFDNAARIEGSEFENEVIERGAEIVDYFSDQNAEGEVQR